MNFVERCLKKPHLISSLVLLAAAVGFVGHRQILWTASQLHTGQMLRLIRAKRRRSVSSRVTSRFKTPLTLADCQELAARNSPAFSAAGQDARAAKAQWRAAKAASRHIFPCSGASDVGGLSDFAVLARNANAVNRESTTNQTEKTFDERQRLSP